MYVEDVGGVGDVDAASGGSRNVDVVEADGQLGDDLEARAAVHEVGIDAVGELYVVGYDSGNIYQLRLDNSEFE